MARWKNKSYPQRPKNIDEIKNLFNDPAILQQYGRTLDNKSQLYIDTEIHGEEHAFCIFSSAATVEFVRHNIAPGQRRYLLDGTFRVVPKEFYQMLTISIEYENDVSFWF